MVTAILSDQEDEKEEDDTEEDAAEEIEELTEDETPEQDFQETEYDEVGILQARKIYTRNISSSRSHTQECQFRFGNKCLKIIVDSGASQHICGQENILHNIRKGNPVEIENACAKKTK